MDRTNTAREALLAELLGEVLELIRRVESLPPVIDGSRDTLTDAADRLAATAETLKVSAETLSATTQRRIAEFIVRSADDARKHVIEEQTRAMAQTSKSIVAQEIAPALKRVAEQLRSLGRQQTANCVLQAAIGGVAGIVASLGTTALVLRFLLH